MGLQITPLQPNKQKIYFEKEFQKTATYINPATGLKHLEKISKEKECGNIVMEVSNSIFQL